VTFVAFRFTRTALAKGALGDEAARALGVGRRYAGDAAGRVSQAQTCVVLGTCWILVFFSDR